MPDFINTIDALGDDVVFASIVDRSITEYADDLLTSLGEDAFNSCKKLTSVNLPALTSVGYSAFSNCSALVDVNLPLVKNTLYMAFDGCKSLANITLPSCPKLDYIAFRGCTSLATVDLHVTNELWGNPFQHCTSLDKLVLRNNAVCSLNSPAFEDTPIEAGSGYIFVPASLVDSYKTATNWSAYANQIRAIEDYTVDGTVTGELDFSAMEKELTAEGYLKYGLSWQLDGINNTGTGHSNSATEWVPLVGASNLTLSDATKMSWGEDCLTNTGGVAYCTNAPVPSLTVEILFQNTRVAPHVCVAIFGANNSQPAHMLALNEADCATFVNTSHRYTNLGVSYTDKMAITIVYSDVNGYAERVYVNGTLLSELDNASLVDSWGRALTASPGIQYLRFFDYVDGNGGSTYHMQGSIYSFRAYNRKLTEAEIQQNYAVDVERFGLTN